MGICVMQKATAVFMLSTSFFRIFAYLFDIILLVCYAETARGADTFS